MINCFNIYLFLNNEMQFAEFTAEGQFSDGISIHQTR